MKELNEMLAEYGMVYVQDQDKMTIEELMKETVKHQKQVEKIDGGDLSEKYYNMFLDRAFYTIGKLEISNIELFAPDMEMAPEEYQKRKWSIPCFAIYYMININQGELQLCAQPQERLKVIYEKEVMENHPAFEEISNEYKMKLLFESEKAEELLVLFGANELLKFHKKMGPINHLPEVTEKIKEMMRPKYEKCLQQYKGERKKISVS